MKNKMALRRFALRAASGYGGSSAAVDFARDLIGCFGDSVVAGGAADGCPSGSGDLVYGHSFSTVTDGKRSKRTVAAYWPSRRVLVEVVDRQTPLDAAWKDLLHACLQMDGEPQYVVLSNQRDLQLYDLARDRSAPRLSIANDELPKYSEAFVFFEPDWVPGTPPKIINVDKVSKEVADLVAKVYRALRKAHGAKRTDEVIRFTLQCIVAMFAEDIGLLPKEYFTSLLYRGAEEGDVEARLKKLFGAMSSEKGGRDGIPYFNGGLFRKPITLPLAEAPLRALIKAAESNWKYVDPHIFGSVFQGIMDDAERHASGAHYTAREDIMSVVGPTIVEPWRARIAAASTMNELRQILKELGAYRVLDPACGSGNFLYVAFRELYRVETEVLHRMHEFPSAKKGRDRIGWDSRIRTTNFYGIDINPFAVELAKTTLNIAKKIAFDERKAMLTDLYGQGVLEVDPSLPLDNLDDNIRCGDALLAPWPAVDAIVGNPPFLSASKAQAELGRAYLNTVRDNFEGCPGRADFCCYFFRKAHESLNHGGRAGLVGTNTIRQNVSREASLDHIVSNGATIVHAVSTQPWSGAAAVHVSIVNWVKGQAQGPFVLQWQDAADTFKQQVALARIPTSLSFETDVTGAKVLSANTVTKRCFQGQTHGHEGFLLDLPAARAKLAASGAASRVLYPFMTANDLLGRGAPSRYVIDFTGFSESEAAKHRGLFNHVRELVKTDRENAAAREQQRNKAALAKSKNARTNRHHANFLAKWWQMSYPREDMLEQLGSIPRYAACGRVTKRPIFVFLANTIRPNDALVVFMLSDDYSFGILSSGLHWHWFRARCSTLEDRPRYTSNTVFDSFPWPQAPTEAEVTRVATAARALRQVRRQLMAENGWSLRALYQAAEVAGPHPLKDAHATLDAAVDAAYGKPADQEATEFLLEMNLALAEDEAAGETIQGPGLPTGCDAKDPRWFSTDSIEPPPLELGEDDDG